MADENHAMPARGTELGLTEAEYAQLESEFDGLRLLRDEMRVQLDLVAMEARDRFQAAEDRWHALEARMQDLSGGEAVSGERVRIARNLFKEIREAYQEIARLVRPRED